MTTPEAVCLTQRLSGEGHQRIRDAYAEADLILLRMTGSLHTLYNAEHGLLPSELEAMKVADSKSLESLFADRRFISFQDYCARGSAAVQVSEARMEAARIVLKAIAQEFARVGSWIECWKAIQLELGKVASEFKLTETESQIVWTELKKDPGFEGVTKPISTLHTSEHGLPRESFRPKAIHDTTDKEACKAERRGALKTYQAECKRAGLTVSQAMIAESASDKWHGRTAITKWLACDPRYDGEPDRLIRAVFAKKIHLSTL